jgi:branched-chain amino acid transport system substrate-binding protein
MNKHILAATSACSPSPAANAWADHLVAIAGPMTGQYASAGDQIRKGAEMAIADINAKGGVLGQKLKLEVGDDACDPKQAVSVANTMVNKKIVFMHGHWCSSVDDPGVRRLCNEAQIPMAPCRPTRKVTERGLKNIFRIMGRDDQQGLVAGAYLAEKFKGKKIAVVDDKSAYGKGLADEVAKAMEAKGVKPALRESITAGEKDYSGLVSKLKSAGVEVMAYGGYHTEVALILRQAQQAGLKLTVMGGDTMTNTELVTAAGPAADNVLFTFGPIRARTRRRRRRQEVPRCQDRTGRLRDVRLRRLATLRPGRRPRPRARSTPTSRKRCAPAASTPSSASSPSTPRATTSCPASWSISGRAASTTT